MATKHYFKTNFDSITDEKEAVENEILNELIPFQVRLKHDLCDNEQYKKLFYLNVRSEYINKKLSE